jgi:predicted ATPase
MVYLKSATYIKNDNGVLIDFPFSVPVMRNMSSISFNSNVTILIGNNGAGKSTLLEAICCSINAIRIGNENMHDDEEFEKIRKLSSCLKLSWTVKKNNALFLRAEDFITYTRHLSNIKKEMQREIRRVDEEYVKSSTYAKSLAKIPYYKSLYEMENMYEGNLSEKSHGESFIEFFRSRLKPNSLYVLDEPETPLSPMNQIVLLGMIKEMVLQGCQFIIATYSPIITAFPDAVIYDLNDGEIKSISYNEIESVNLLKSFLNNPDSYLRFL